MNTLYPIFIKTDCLKFLIIGGGNVALEKLKFLLKSSPEAFVTVIGIELKKELLEIKGENVSLIKRSFQETDLGGKDIILAATGDRATNLWIRSLAKSKGKLVNVADMPDLCDFYLGSIITKGDVKIAISTNGKSPTLAKKMREFLEDVLPDDIDNLANNLSRYRKSLKLDLEQKIKHLNQLTQLMLSEKNKIPNGK